MEKELESEQIFQIRPPRRPRDGRRPPFDRPPVGRPPVGPPTFQPPVGRPPVGPPTFQPPVGRPPVGPPTFQPPIGRPPATGIPPRPLAVDPGAIRNCLNRPTNVSLIDGSTFMFYPTYVGPTSVAGWQLLGHRWVFIGIDLYEIRFFSCF